MSAVDGASQRFFLAILGLRILRLYHYSLLAGHPGERLMYDTMRQEVYSPHMSNHRYVTVKDCQSCASNWRDSKRHRELHLFPPTAPLEVVAIDILGPLLKIKTEYQFIVVMTDRFSKLAKATPTAKTTAKTLAQIFLNDWMANFGIPAKQVFQTFWPIMAAVHLEVLPGDICRTGGESVNNNRIPRTEKRLGGTIQRHEGIKAQALHFRAPRQ